MIDPMGLSLRLFPLPEANYGSLANRCKGEVLFRFLIMPTTHCTDAIGSSEPCLAIIIGKNARCGPGTTATTLFIAELCTPAHD